MAGRGKEKAITALLTILLVCLCLGCTAGGLSADEGREAGTAAQTASTAGDFETATFEVTPDFATATPGLTLPLAPPPTPTPTFTPVPTPTPAPTPFSVVWISDTQNYSLQFPEVFSSLSDWVLETGDEYNVQFFVHTGDVTDNGYSEAQWEVANEALLPLVERYPSLIVAGNHDIGKSGSFRRFLSQPCVAPTLREGQLYEDGAASYALFEAGGSEFIVLGISWGIDEQATYNWARNTLQSYPDRIGIIITHSALESDGSLTGPGYRLHTRVIAACPNVRLVLCGHYREGVRRLDLYDDDGDGEAERSVNTLMYNYQENHETGLGYVCILSFDPVAREISAYTYSPYYQRVREGDEGCFILEAAF
ncbi:MAG: metallophosphoesterase [Clostridia bacterium]|nr:metallophosphoesterase [Clostridia bacterium]